MGGNHEEIEDELLVFQCQDGDAEALRVLIARWQPRLGRLAWRLTAEREAARDAMQEAWLSIIRGLSGLDDPARFRTWAFRIVRNKCADRLRRRVARRQLVQGVSAGDSGGHRGDARDSSRVDADADLQAALLMLPGEQRAILALHYLEGMDLALIARVLGVPRGTVKSRMHTAREKLREAFERVTS